MVRVIKLRKGLDIRLKGVAKLEKTKLPQSAEYALTLSSFVGVSPKVMVKEGDVIKCGEVLFVSKQQPEVKFCSPVSGIVSLIERGDRRKLLSIKVKADTEQQFLDFTPKITNNQSGSEIKRLLLDSGLFGFINQLPYAVVADAYKEPKAIFISALRDMPLACNFEYELKGQEVDFQTGLTALSKIAKTYLGIGSRQTSPALLDAKDVEINIFDGKCPAGNVGVQINHISPVNKGEIVWTVDPSVVIFIGRLINKGRLDLTRIVAVSGSEINNPHYVEVIVGAPIADILTGQLNNVQGKRIINGNPLTGKKESINGYLGAHSSEVSVIAEGDNSNELFGWIMPRLNQFSTSRSYFSWLLGKKEYDFDTRIKGGERHMIMSGEYDKVLPMDIYGEYLIKAIISGNIDKQEALGIYEVSPEDFALAEFVDSSKLELQKIVRQGLDILRKENA